MPYKKNLDSRKRILNIISEMKRDSGGSLTTPANLSSTVKGTSGIDLYELKHTQLADMPSSTNTDHDGRYRTETELASTANGEGASMIGIEDDGTYYTGTDVEAALQEIGSDLAGLSSPWQRTGTVLSPATAGDTVELAQTSTTGSALSVTRDLASGSTDAPVVFIKQDNAGDDQSALTIFQDGTGGSGITLQSAGSYGIYATSGGAYPALYGGSDGSGASAVRGQISGTSASENDTYGGVFTRTNLGTWGDVAESSDTPLATSPPAGFVRVIAGADGRLYAFDSSGNRHDLGEHTPHYFPAWVAAQNAAKGKTWDSDAYNDGLGLEAAVTATPVANFDFTNEYADSSHGYWTWNAACAGGGPFLYTQSQVAVWTPLDRQGDNNDNCRCYVQCRFKVNNPAYFENIYLFLNDMTTANANANKVKSSDLVASLSANTWYIATLNTSGTDIGGWNAALRAGIFAQGKLYGEETEETKTEIYIDYIKVYMFAN